jgi:FkbM family methyltransferase
MSFIKNALLRTLGEKRYLETLRSTFQVMLRRHWLSDSAYQDVYFLKKHISPGDSCVDIGAHLGYYCFELARLCGPEGKVNAVEPVSKFNSVIEKYMKGHSFRGLKLCKVALGGDGPFVEMGIPRVGNRKRFAFAKIIEQQDTFSFVETERVPNEDPNLLFGDLSRIDFIKCDVEGFEVRLFTKMLPTVARFRPKLLCELGSGEIRQAFAELVRPLGYSCFRLHEGKWESLDPYGTESALSHNYYFLTADHLASHPELVR